MAAKIVSGANGSVTFPTGAGEAGQTVQMYQFTMTVEKDIYVISNYDDTDNWEKVQGGMSRCSGSAEGFFDADTADTDKIAAFAVEDDVADAAITLTAYTSKTFAFAGIISNFTVNHSKTGGLVTCSFNFRSSGAVTEA